MCCCIGRVIDQTYGYIIQFSTLLEKCYFCFVGRYVRFHWKHTQHVRLYVKRLKAPTELSHKQVTHSLYDRVPLVLFFTTRNLVSTFTQINYSLYP